MPAKPTLAARGLACASCMGHREDAINRRRDTTVWRGGALVGATLHRRELTWT
jgi:hypothetical protein